MTSKKSARLTRRAALAAAGAGAATALGALLTPAQAYYNRPTVRPCVVVGESRRVRRRVHP